MLGCLGRDHWAWLGDYVVEAANAIAASGRPVTLFNLGAEAPPLRGLEAGIEVLTPGFLDAEIFAARLAATDVFLVPTVDGASTRRGSLMAALQHGLPVLATDGDLTDGVLRREGLRPAADRGRRPRRASPAPRRRWRATGRGGSRSATPAAASTRASSTGGDRPSAAGGTAGR